MKTDDLVSMLSTGAEPVDPKRVAWRYLLAVGGGSLAALALMATTLKLNPALPHTFGRQRGMCSTSFRCSCAR